MNLQDKEAIAREWVTAEAGVFARRTVPLRLDTDAKREAEIRDIIRRIANTIPDRFTAEQINAALQELGDTLNANLKTAGWPTIQEVGSNLSPIVGRMSDATPRQKTQTDNLPAWQAQARIDAERINCSESVSEWSLYGRRAAYMVNEGLVKPFALDRYRKAHRYELVRTYGEAFAHQRITELELVR